MEQSNSKYYRLVLVRLVLFMRSVPFSEEKFPDTFALNSAANHVQEFVRAKSICTLEWIYKFRPSHRIVAPVLPVFPHRAATWESPRRT